MRSRRALFVGAGVAGVVLATVIAFLVVDAVRERRALDDEMPQRCGPPLDDCRRFAAGRYGAPAPRLPSAASVGPYAFTGGEESGEAVFFGYTAGKPGDTVFFVVRPRRPESGQPPAGYDGGLVEGRDGDGRLRRLDWWDDRFHYFVGTQGADLAGADLLHQLAASAR